MFTWNKRNIEWFIESSSYSNFHKNLAGIISNLINKDSTMLDIGAGLGCLDYELSNYCNKITLIEPNIEAYNYLQDNKKSNFEIHNTTYEEYSLNNNEKHDYLLLSFFSRMDKANNYKELSNLCKQKIIYIRNESHGSNDSLIKYLNEKDIRYTFKHYELDFSQPLQLDDVDDFLETYYSPLDDLKKLDFYERIEDKKDFFLFKNIKQISIFVIDTN